MFYSYSQKPYLLLITYYLLLKKAPYYLLATKAVFLLKEQKS